MAWAEPEDVLNYTRVQATEEEIFSAQLIVELFANTTEDATENISERNLRLLSAATAYQTAWMQAHPDVFTNVDVTSLSQDGVSGSLAHANAQILAPLTKRCIDRLTWHNTPLRVRTADGRYIDRSNRDSAVHDDQRSWTPAGLTSGGSYSTGGDPYR